MIRLSVMDIITTDPDLEKGLADIAQDDDVHALIVRINSPGGTAAGGEALYYALRGVAQKKPVVAVMDETAASAAYMAALGADYIVARKSSITGSIGVIFQSADISGLLEKLGVKPEAVRSGALKARPNPLEPMSAAVRAATERVVMDIHDLFVGLVADRRGLDLATVRGFADGRVFTGREAQGLGLVDALGGEGEAQDWLKAAHGVTPDLPIRDFDPHEEAFGLSHFFGSMLEKVLFSESLRLDGLLSLWHPEGR